MTLYALETETEQHWQHSARCRDEDPNRMQPEVASPEDVEAAMAVCVGCPVRLQCRQLAEDQAGGAYGVHAGMWYGEPPRNPAAEQCGWCGEDMEAERSTASYCSGRCRVAAHRARVAQAIPA